jgi:hypothetical protein
LTFHAAIGSRACVDWTYTVEPPSTANADPSGDKAASFEIPLVFNPPK